MVLIYLFSIITLLGTKEYELISPKNGVKIASDKKELISKIGEHILIEKKIKIRDIQYIENDSYTGALVWYSNGGIKKSNILFTYGKECISNDNVCYWKKLKTVVPIPQTRKKCYLKLSITQNGDITYITNCKACSVFIFSEMDE